MGRCKDCHGVLEPHGDADACPVVTMKRLYRCLDCLLEVETSERSVWSKDYLCTCDRPTLARVAAAKGKKKKKKGGEEEETASLVVAAEPWECAASGGADVFGKRVMVLETWRRSMARNVRIGLDTESTPGLPYVRNAVEKSVPRHLWKLDGPALTYTTIERVERPSSAEFYHKYVKHGLPVIITGLTDDEMAGTGWSNDFFRQTVGEQRMPVRLSHDAATSTFGDVTKPGPQVYTDAEMTMGEYIDAIERGDRGVYAARVLLRDVFPELAKLIPECPYREVFGAPVSLGPIMYFGGGGQTTSTHYDGEENMFFVADGEKELILFHPSNCDLLYPKLYGFSLSQIPAPDLIALVDARERGEAPPAAILEQFPLAAFAKPLRCVVRRGEMLYLPSNWYHCVRGGHGRNVLIAHWFAPGAWKCVDHERQAQAPV